MIGVKDAKVIVSLVSIVFLAQFGWSVWCLFNYIFRDDKCVPISYPGDKGSRWNPFADGYKEPISSADLESADVGSTGATPK